MNLSTRIEYAHSVKVSLLLSKVIYWKEEVLTAFWTLLYIECARISSLTWWSSNLIDCNWWVLSNRYWIMVWSHFKLSFNRILSHYTINDFPVVSQGIMIFVVFIALSHRFVILRLLNGLWMDLNGILEYSYPFDPSISNW